MKLFPGGLPYMFWYLRNIAYFLFFFSNSAINSAAYLALSWSMIALISSSASFLCNQIDWVKQGRELLQGRLTQLFSTQTIEHHASHRRINCWPQPLDIAYYCQEDFISFNFLLCDHFLEAEGISKWLPFPFPRCLATNGLHLKDESICVRKVIEDNLIGDILTLEKLDTVNASESGSWTIQTRYNML